MPRQGCIRTDRFRSFKKKTKFVKSFFFLWDLTPCSPLKDNLRFRWKYRLRICAKYQANKKLRFQRTTQSYSPEDKKFSLSSAVRTSDSTKFMNIRVRIKKLVFFQIGTTDLFKRNGKGARYSNLISGVSQNNSFDNDFQAFLVRNNTLRIWFHRTHGVWCNFIRERKTCNISDFHCSSPESYFFLKAVS
jgi:hypothetical protein